MSSSSLANATLAEINAIKTSSVIFVRVWCFSMIILGVMGHTLNVYTFTRPILRHNPCSRYFLASAFSGYLVVCMNFPIRLLQLGYNKDLLSQSKLGCQILQYLIFWARAQTSWFIVLASIDRFLCSSKSVRLRSWSSLAMTHRAIPITSLLVLLAYFHVPIYHAVNIEQRMCYAIPGFYQKFFGVWNLIVFSVGPPLLMLLFGLLTVQHIHKLVGRVLPNASKSTATARATGSSVPPDRRQHRKNADRELIQMLLFQSCLLTLTATPTSVQYIYTSVRQNMIVDDLQREKDNLFFVVAGFLSLTGPCMSFYFFTLSSKLFRRELMRLLPGKRQAIH